ncbi:CRISPR-associated helicase Cas3' [uncultured Faecalibaculum sp.]|uniref:CRISPR-associated helicase Cas3' n=1 Tax=uncultured Faecalibaculum sp. TaxID=1729681 RepID=UPI0025DA5952|nr:CRISPR-associated helicase Cas3' [uncultured Faecalibaculum sp.]
MDWKLLGELEAACKGAVAKTDAENGCYLPLWMHMTDTAGVMVELYRHRVSEQEKQLFIQQGIDSLLLEKLFALIGMLHDIGKATCVFQSMILEKLKDYAGFRGNTLPYKQFGISGYMHHSESGMLILASLGFSEAFASVVGGHHGKTQDALLGDASHKAKKLISDNPVGMYGDVEKKEFWQKTWERIAETACRICGINHNEIPSLSLNSWLLLSGILVEADWISSNTAYFPLIPINKSSESDIYPQRIEKGWDELALTSVWQKHNPEMDETVFEKMFGFHPNSVQAELIQIVSNCSDPGILVVEAQMGVGKTEAALAAADVFAEKRGSGGIYFGLPTQATSNGLFPRFKKWVEYESHGGKQSMKLAHGMAAFNEEYRKIPHGTARLNEDGKEGDSSLIVHDWMQGRKVGMMSDFVVGTVDQGLMSALNQRHVMLRHAGIAGKTVIIDEVHAYDAYMNVYLVRMLEWLGSYHAPVILLSATLPKSRRVELVHAYQKGRYGKKYKEKGDADWQTASGYPLVTWTDGQQIASRALLAEENEKNVLIVKEEIVSTADEAEKICRSLTTNLVDGGVAGIIVNTVKKAQEVAHYLQTELTGWRIIPFHSRYTAMGRSSVETEVLTLAGKGTDDSRKKVRDRLVIVGTQVIEQSLDVDFDLMITELSPMDLLLQRIGRLHRHKDRVRPENLKKPVCHVLIPSNEKADSSVSAVYSGWLQYQTKNNLPDTVSIPGDIPKLVNIVYESADVTAQSETEQEKYRAYQNDEKKEETKASVHPLSPPYKTLRVDHGINGLNISNEKSTDQKGVAGVRDIDSGISCILVQEMMPGIYHPADDNDVILRSDNKLTFDQIQILLKEVITLPASLPYKAADNELEQNTEKVFSLWMKNPVMKDRLILILDVNCNARLAGFELHYSPEFGLECRKTSIIANQ